MKRALASVPLLLLAAACASGGSGPAASPAARPAASAPSRVVLVEVRGKSVEADAFASRFLSEAEDRGVAIVDARLAGAHVAELADPQSAASRNLRESFPGDAYLGFDVGPCETFRRQFSTTGTVDPMTGIRTSEVIGAADVVCTANGTELGADGRTRRSASIEGRVALSGEQPSEDSSTEAARDAASQAARKLFGKRKK